MVLSKMPVTNERTSALTFDAYFWHLIIYLA